MDDHPLVREWLTQLIQRQPDLVVCGEAETADEALRAILREKPDLAIVDLSLKAGTGLELLARLKAEAPGVAPIVLSMHDEALYAERALRAGARGYLMKRETAKSVVTAIRRVLDGRLHLSDALAAEFAEKFPGREPPAGDSRIGQLSNRELEIFQLLGQGCETRKIAATLGISVKTVQAFYARIKLKLELDSALALYREAIRWEEGRRPKARD